ncbi:MAG: hypothetical protein IPL53_08275 [Ignavibacteria bacterium]|nr:hypothetical protein [Ignavibacteria bacterium]
MKIRIQKQFKSLKSYQRKEFSLFIGGSKSNTNRLSGEVYQTVRGNAKKNK